MSFSLHFRRFGLPAWLVLVGIATVLIHGVWIWQGLDVTDEGYNLTRQWLVIHSPENYEFGMTWLSDLVGGVWLTLVAKLGVIGARLGWVLVQALTAVVSFAVVQRFFSRPVAFLAIVATAATLVHRGTLTIDYNNLPAVLLMVWAGCVLFSQDATISPLRRRSVAVVGGVLLGLAVMARFPVILALPLPLALRWFSSAIERRKSSRPDWRMAWLAVASSLGSIVLCFLLLAATGYLRPLFNGLTSSLSSSMSSATGHHSVLLLLQIYATTTRRALSLGGQILLLCTAGFAVCVTGGFLGIRVLLQPREKTRVHSRIPRIVPIGLAVLGCATAAISQLVLRPSFVARFLSSDGILGASTISRINILNQRALIGGAGLAGLGGFLILWRRFGKRFVDLMRIRVGRMYAALFLLTAGLTGALCLAAIHYYVPTPTIFSFMVPGVCLLLLIADFVMFALFRAPTDLKNHANLLVVGFLVASLSMIGSNNGIRAANAGLWLLLPAVCLSAARILSEVSCRKFRLLGGNGEAVLRSRMFTGVALSLLLALGIVGLSARRVNPYRDLEDRSQLTTVVDHPLLRGVRTSPERAASLEELLGEMAERTEAGDRVLAWDSIPMVHFLTRTIPALGNPWPNLLSDLALRQRMDRMWNTGGPDLVVEAVVNTRLRTWSVVNRPAPTRESMDLVSELEENGYVMVWRNEEFVIWRREA